MPRQVHIVAELLLEHSEIPINLIQEKIRNETKIPWCNSIKEIVVDDLTEYCKSLKRKGVSVNVVENLIQHFYYE
jgi:hypothetical protein